MGIDISAMSLWENNAMIGGYCKANGGEVGDGLSDDDVDRLGSLLDAVA